MREILVDLERNRVRVVFRCNEDEAVIRLKLGEAKDLAGKIENVLRDYQQRRGIRID